MALLKHLLPEYNDKKLKRSDVNLFGSIYFLLWGSDEPV